MLRVDCRSGERTAPRHQVWQDFDPRPRLGARVALLGRRVNKLEWLDEIEEWVLFLDHYFVLVAAKGPGGHIS